MLVQRKGFVAAILLWFVLLALALFAASAYLFAFAAPVYERISVEQTGDIFASDTSETIAERGSLRVTGYSASGDPEGEVIKDGYTVEVYSGGSWAALDTPVLSTTTINRLRVVYGDLSAEINVTALAVRFERLTAVYNNPESQAIYSALGTENLKNFISVSAEYNDGSMHSVSDYTITTAMPSDSGAAAYIDNVSFNIQATVDGTAATASVVVPRITFSRVARVYSIVPATAEDHDFQTTDGEYYKQGYEQSGEVTTALNSATGSVLSYDTAPGLQVLAEYNDGRCVLVRDENLYTLSGFLYDAAAAAGKTFAEEITITYRDSYSSATGTVTVTVTMEEYLAAQWNVRTNAFSGSTPALSSAYALLNDLNAQNNALRLNYGGWDNPTFSLSDISKNYSEAFRIYYVTAEPEGATAVADIQSAVSNYGSSELSGGTYYYDGGRDHFSIGDIGFILMYREGGADKTGYYFEVETIEPATIALLGFDSVFQTYTPAENLFKTFTGFDAELIDLQGVSVRYTDAEGEHTIENAIEDDGVLCEAVGGSYTVRIKNAGEYSVTFAISDENYIWSRDSIPSYVTISEDGKEAVYTWTVQRASLGRVGVENVQGWVVGDSIAESDLLGKYFNVTVDGSAIDESLAPSVRFAFYGVSADGTSWNYPAEAPAYDDFPDAAGSNYYVTAEIAASRNYLSAVSETFAMLSVGRYEVSAPVPGNRDYNGQIQYAQNADTEFYTVESEPGTDVGTYNVTFRLISTHNYEWESEEYKGQESITLTWQIEKAQTSVKITAMPGWVYGGSAVEPVYTKSGFVPDGAVSITYSADEAGVFTGEVPQNAGTWYVKVEIAESDNYYGSSDTVAFSIEKKAVARPSIDYTSGYVYSYGAEIDVMLTGSDGNYYTVSNGTQTEAGTFFVSVELKADYQWNSGNATEILSLKWVIDKLAVGIPVAPAGPFRYSENASGEGIESEYVLSEFNEKALNVTDLSEGLSAAQEDGLYSGVLKALNAGEYTFAVSLKDTDNFEWTDGSSDAKPYSFEIGKMSIGFAALDPDAEYVYSGEPLFAVFSAPEKIGKYYTVSGDSATNAGDHFAVVTPTANYAWESVPEGGSVTGSLELLWHIQKCAVTEPEAAGGKYIYAHGAELTFGLNGFDGERMSVEGNVQTEAGSYSVTVSLRDPDNYSWSENDGSSEALEFPWTIVPFAVTEPTAPSAPVHTYSRAEYTYSPEYDSQSITLSGNTGKDADTYTAVFSLKSKTNYVWKTGGTDDKTVLWTIARAEVGVPTVQTEYVYAHGAQIGVLLAEGGALADTEYYTVSGNTGTDAGENYLLSLTPTKNYCWAGGSVAAQEISWKILPYRVAIPETDRGVISAYTGETICLEKEGDDTDYYTFKDTYFAVNADKYVAYAALLNANYVWNDEAGSTADIAIAWEIETYKIQVSSIIGSEDAERRFEYQEGKSREPSLNTDAIAAFITKSGLFDSDKSPIAESVGYGAYYAGLSLNDSENYEWVASDPRDVVDGGLLYIWYEITKAQYTPDVTMPDREWTYGENGGEISAGDHKDGDEVAVISYEYFVYRESTERYESIGSDAPTDAGRYRVDVTYAETANFAAMKVSFEFTIEKFSVETIVWSENNYIYNGEEQSVTAQFTGIAADGTISLDVTLVGGGAFKNAAKGYEFAARIPELYARNYAFAASAVVQKTYSIAKREVILTVDSAWMYYGQSPSEVAFGYGYADSVGEENRFVAGESNSLDFATDATAQSPVGSYRIYVAQKELSNYTIRQTEGTLEVKARPIIVTFENAETAYGDLLDLSENSEFYKTVSVAQGAELGAAAAIVNGDAAPFGFVTAAEQYSSVGKYLITGAGKNENYAIVFEGTDGANSVHTVVQREIRVAIGVSGKTYDNSPIVVTADAVGLVNRDTVEFAFEYTGRDSTVYSGGAPKNAGLYTVSVSLPESGTAAQGNYALVGTEEYPTQKNFAISKKTLTVTADPATVVYGDAAAAMSVSYSDFAKDEDESALGGTLSFEWEKEYTVGDKAGSVFTAEPQGLTSDNYDIRFVSGTLTVVKREITIEIYSQNSVYDGEEPAVGSALNTNYVVTVGELPENAEHYPAIVLAKAPGVDVGAYALSVASYDSENYIVETAAGAGKYIVSEADIVGIDTIEGFTSDYTGLLLKFAEKANLKGVSAVHERDGLTWTFEVNGEEAEGVKDAGKYTVSFTVSAPNHTPSSGEFSVTINAVSLTITANDDSVVYGYAWTQPADGGFTAVGFVNGETAASYDIAVTLTADYEPGDGISKEGRAYTITPEEFVIKNYTIVFVPGTLTVERRTVTAEITPNGGKYGNVTPAAYTVENVYEKDDLGIALWYSGTPNGGAEGSYAETTAVPVKAGAYVVYAKITNENYTFVSGEAQMTSSAEEFIIGKALLTVTPDEDKSAEYGEAAPEFTYSIEGFVHGENSENAGIRYGDFAFTTDYSVGDGISKEGVSYSVFHEGELSADNYDFSYKTGVFTVLPRAVTVTLLPQRAEYAHTVLQDAVSTAQGTGWEVSAGSLYGGNDPQIFLTLPDNAVNVGEYAYKTVDWDNENYAVTFENAAENVFSIYAKVIRVEIGGNVYDYGESAGVTVTPAKGEVFAGDSISFTVSYRGTPNGGSPTEYGETVPLSAGQYTVTVTGITGESAANYALAEEAPEESYTVNKRAITVTVKGVSIYYGEDVTEGDFSVEYGNLAQGEDYAAENAAIAAAVEYNWTYLPGNGITDGVTKYFVTLSEISSDNYAVERIAGELTVLPRPITVQIDYQSIEYGEENIRLVPGTHARVAAGQFGLYSSKDSDADVYALVYRKDGEQVTPKNAGSYEIAGEARSANYAIKFEGQKSANGEYTAGAAVYTISKKSLSISFIDEYGVYNGRQQGIGIKVGGGISSDEVTATVYYKRSGDPDSAYTEKRPVSAGNYFAQVRIDSDNAGNYDFGTVTTTLSFEITRAPYDPGIYFDGKYTFTYDGQEKIPAYNGSLQVSDIAGDGIPVELVYMEGTYDLSQSAPGSITEATGPDGVKFYAVFRLVNENYQLSRNCNYIETTVVIEPKAIDIVWTEQTHFAYNGQDQSGSIAAQYTPFGAEKPVLLVVDRPVFKDHNGGKAYVFTVDGFPQNDNPLNKYGVTNYVLPEQESGNLSNSYFIDRYAVTIVAASPSITYGERIPTDGSIMKYDYVGDNRFFENIMLSVYAYGTDGAVLMPDVLLAAGTYTTKVNLETSESSIRLLQNYAVTANEGVLTVNKREISIEISDQRATYNGAEPTVHSTAYILTKGELPQEFGSAAYPSLTLVKEEGVNVATYEITLDPDYNPNYTITVDKNGTFTIEKRDLSVTEIAGFTAVYNGEDYSVYDNMVKNVSTGVADGAALSWIFVLDGEPIETLKNVCVENGKVVPYEIGYTVSAGSNYSEYTDTIFVTIKKGTVTITPAFNTQAWRYNDVPRSLSYTAFVGSEEVTASIAYYTTAVPWVQDDYAASLGGSLGDNPVAGYYKVVLSVAETDNYLEASRTIEWEILRDSIGVHWERQNVSLDDITEGSYTENSIINYSEALTIVGGNIAADAGRGTVDLTGITERGTYNVIVQIVDVNNYEWANPDAGNRLNMTISFAVASAANNITVYVNGDVWNSGEIITIIYSEDFPLLSATADYGEVVFSYAEENGGDAPENLVYGYNKPVNSGAYWIRARAEGDNNMYGIGLAYIKLVIEPKPINKPAEKPDAEDDVYTGESIVYDTEKHLDGFDSSLMQVIGGEQRLANENGHTVTISLIDSSNYKWSDGSDGPVTVVWVIRKQALKAPSFKGGGLTVSSQYDAQNLLWALQDFDPVTMGVNKTSYAAYTTMPDGITGAMSALMRDGGAYVGEHSFAVYLKDSGNYKWADGASEEIVMRWNITPRLWSLAEIEDLGVSFEDGSFEYNGKVQMLSLTGAEYLPIWISVEYRTQSGTGGVENYNGESGETVYAVFRSVDQNYALEEGGSVVDSLSLSANLKITRVEISASGITWSGSDSSYQFEYSGTDYLSQVTAYYHDINGAIRVLNAVPEGFSEMKDAGEYLFRAEMQNESGFDRNYVFAADVGTVKYSVTPRTVNVVLYDQSYMYSGAVHVLGQGQSYYTIDRTVFDGFGIEIIFADEAERIDAGTYPDAITARYSGTGAANYHLVIEEADLIVAPKPISVTITPNGSVYGDESPAGAVVLPEHIAGLVSGENAAAFAEKWIGIEYRTDEGLITSVPAAAGSYTVYAVIRAIEGETCNYTLSETVATYTVAKREISAVIIDKVFTGELLTVSLADIAGELYGAEIIIDANPGRTGAGTAEVTLVLADADNYKWSGSEDAAQTFRWNVVRAANSIVQDIEISGWTYGEEAEEPTGAASAFDGKDEGVKPAYIWYAYSAGGYIELNEKPVNAGSYGVKVYYADTENVIGAAGDIKPFTIEKAVIDIASYVTFEDKTVIYNGASQELLVVGELPSFDGHPVTVHYVYGAEQGDRVNVGEYNITAIFAIASGNYLFKAADAVPSETAEITRVLTIQPFTIQTIVWEGQDYTYDAQDHASQIRAYYIGADGQSIALAVTSENGAFVNYRADGYVFSADFASEAGSTERLNYAFADSLALTQKYAVRKRAVTVQIADVTGAVYGEEEKPFAGWTVTDGDLCGQTLDIELSREPGDAAGRYAINGINRNENFEVTFKPGVYEIVAKVFGADGAIAITLPDAEDLVYDGQHKAASDNGSNYGVDVILRYTGTTNDGKTYSSTVAPSEAGNYIVTAYSQDPNYVLDGISAEFEIRRMAAEEADGFFADIADGIIDSRAYTGNTIVASGLDGSLYFTVYENKGGIRAGMYPVLLRLVDPNNFCWNEPDAQDASIKTYYLEITQAENTVSEPRMSGWTYGEAAAEPAAAALFGDVEFRYYAAGGISEPLSGKPTDAGVYYVQAYVVGTEDYTGAESALAEFTVARAAVALGVQIDSWTFGESAAVPAVTGNAGGGLVTFRYTGTANDGTEWNSKAAPSLAGNYVLTVKVAQTLNYSGGESSVPFTIFRAASQIDVSGVQTEFAYNGAAQTVNAGAVLNHDEAELVYSNNTFTGVVEGHGLVVRISVSQSCNYEAASATVTLTVNKAEISPALTIENWTYGSTAAVPEVEGAGEGVIAYRYTGIANDGTAWDSASAPTKAGKYTLTVSIPETANYNAGSASADFVIERIKLVSPTLGDSGSYTDEAVLGNTYHTEILTDFDPNTMGILGTDTVAGFVVNEQGEVFLLAMSPGTYTVTVFLKDANNYEWADVPADVAGNASVSNLKLTMNIAEAEVSLLWLVVTLSVLLAIELVLLAFLLSARKQGEGGGPDDSGIGNGGTAPEGGSPAGDDPADGSSAGDDPADGSPTGDDCAGGSPTGDDSEGGSPAGDDSEGGSPAGDNSDNDSPEGGSSSVKTYSILPAGILPILAAASVPETAACIALGAACLILGVAEIVLLVKRRGRRTDTGSADGGAQESSEELPAEPVGAEECAPAVLQDDRSQPEPVADASKEQDANGEITEIPSAEEEEPAIENEPLAAEEEDGSEELSVAAAEAEDDDEEYEEDEEAEDRPEDLAAFSDESEHADAENSFAVVDGKKVYYLYKFSFRAKLIQSAREVQLRYSAIMDEAAAASGVKASLSWRQMRIYSGRRTLASLFFKGRTLCIAFALDPAQYAETKYRGVDLSAVKRYQKTPLMLRLTSERRLRYARYLLNQTFSSFGIERGEVIRSDFYLPYQTTDELIAKGLVKVLSNETVVSNENLEKADIAGLIRDKVTVKEAQIILTNEAAASLIENEEPALRSAQEQREERPEKKAAGAVRGIVNIDTLSINYQPNEVVDLQSLKDKKLISKRVGFVKVLARGYLNKPLIVKAQDFSIDAAKMIILTGGRVIRKS